MYRSSATEVPPGFNSGGMLDYIVAESGLSWCEICAIFQDGVYQLCHLDVELLRVELEKVSGIEAARRWIGYIDDGCKLELLPRQEWEELNVLLGEVMRGGNDSIALWWYMTFRYMRS